MLAEHCVQFTSCFRCLISSSVELLDWFIMSIYYVLSQQWPAQTVCAVIFFFSFTILSIQIIASILSLSFLPSQTLSLHYLNQSLINLSQKVCAWSRLSFNSHLHFLFIFSSAIWSLCYHLQKFSSVSSTHLLVIIDTSVNCAEVLT